MQELRNLVVSYLTALWHWRRSALLVAWLISLIGWGIIALLPDRYTVTARLVVDTQTILGPLMADIAVTPDFDRQVTMIRKTLFSEANLVELIERTGIDRQRDVVTPIERADLIEDLSNDIDLKVESENLFTLSYTDNDPDIAYLIVDEMMDIFVQRNLGHSERDVAKASKFIDEQIANYDQKLRQAELRVAEFQREHADELGGAARSVRDLERAEANLRSLRAEFESAMWRRDQIKVKLDSTPRTLSVAQSEGAQSGTQRYLEELNQELVRKRLLYTDEHPDILTLRQLISEAGRQLEEEHEASPQGPGAVRNPLYEQLFSQLEIAELSVNDLGRRLKVAEGEVETLAARAQQSPQAEADLKRLTRDYDVLLVQYEQLIKRREATQLATDLDTRRQRAEFRIVDPPVRPLEPSGPMHGLLLIGVLFVGVGASVGYTVLRFMLSGVVLTSGQLQSAFKKIPVLGGVSIAEAVQRRGLRWFGHLGLTSSTLSLLLVCAFLVYLYEVSEIGLADMLPLAAIAGLFTSTQASAGL
ncbi:MAG: XrtA system polysaccharide chain length determinant [Geminicoccaceae bacterium]